LESLELLNDISLFKAKIQRNPQLHHRIK